MTERERRVWLAAEVCAFAYVFSRGGYPDHGVFACTRQSRALTWTAYALASRHGRRRVA